MKRGAPRHPKVLRLARLLSIPRLYAVGICEALWHFTAEQCRTGNIGKFSNQDIADGIGWDGCPDHLIDALTTARLIDAHDAHRLVVHDWHEHADDGVNLAMVRAVEKFATGEIPRMTRLSVKEREAALAEYDRQSPSTQKHTECPEPGIKSHLPAHKSTLPSPSLPSPALPCPPSPSPALPAPADRERDGVGQVSAAGPEPDDAERAALCHIAPGVVSAILKAHPRPDAPEDARPEIIAAIRRKARDRGGGDVQGAGTIIVAQTKAWAASPLCRSTPARFRKAAAAWFRGGCYDEDPATWEREYDAGSTNGPAPPVRDYDAIMAGAAEDDEKRKARQRR